MSPLDISVSTETPSTGCCPASAALSTNPLDAPSLAPLDSPNADPSAFVSHNPDQPFTLYLLVENLSCPGCIRQIERALNAHAGGVTARMSLSTKRLTVSWTDPEVSPLELVTTLGELGYRVRPFNAEVLSQMSDTQGKTLLKAMGVAGFAWANVMLLSVSVWAGAVSDMDSATRDLFHWISALIALPAVAYAGRPFFASAFQALMARRLNMDVPISLAVLLAVIVSVWQTSISGPHAYFDAALMLLFFLLVGRFLDHRCRSRASTAAENLVALQSLSATVVESGGRTRAVASEALRPGMVVRVLPGDRVPADGVVCAGQSDIDKSVITGESMPEAAVVGDRIYAGSMALTGLLDISIEKSHTDTFLSHVVRLMESAEQNKSKYVRLADRLTDFYAPAVHFAAAATFLGWWVLGAPWDDAVMKAIAVLIITCPCALGLAVPAVQVVASGRLLKAGALLKSGDALERLSEIDTIVFDKTGTLTEGMPKLVSLGDAHPTDLALAASLAVTSRHPLAKALVDRVGPVKAASDVKEWPGLGLSAQLAEGEVRLGSRAWCDVAETVVVPGDVNGCSELWLQKPNGMHVPFFFRDRVRDDASEVVAWAQSQGLDVVLLSGDRVEPAEAVAVQLGIERWLAGQSPEDKIRFVSQLQAQGRRVVMIGDGLNDAPALAAADVSLSPSTAADISQNAADIVYFGGTLSTVPEIIIAAKSANRRVRENFSLALAYNVIALPLAVAGIVTPLIAAVAMSCSSLVVTANAMRGFSRKNSR